MAGAYAALVAIAAGMAGFMAGSRPRPLGLLQDKHMSTDGRAVDVYSSVPIGVATVGKRKAAVSNMGNGDCVNPFSYRAVRRIAA